MTKALKEFNLAGIRNVDFKGFTYWEEAEAELPTFTLKESPAAEWNKKAIKQNTKMFVEILQRQPKNYEEVLNWITSLVPTRNCKRL